MGERESVRVCERERECVCEREEWDSGRERTWKLFLIYEDLTKSQQQHYVKLFHKHWGVD